MESPIYYLAHPWKFNPEKSFLNAVAWTMLLREKGLYVFSPILHSHPYWKELRNLNSDVDNDKFNIVYEYLDKEDWLDWDLKIIEGFMNGEGFIQFKCVKCGGIRDYSFNCCGKITQKQFYDSGVIVLLSNTAFNRKDYILASVGNINEFVALEDPVNWLSQGCRTEYEFAKKHHIRVLELESFLEGKEVDL